MIKPRTRWTLMKTVAFFVASVSSVVSSQTLTLSPEDALQKVINSTQHGDILVLTPGLYSGNFEIPNSITVIGEDGAKIDALGKGTALHITANNVTVRNLIINNWGDDLTLTQAGIKAKGVTHTIIENNTIQGDGFGVYLESTTAATIKGNHVTGNADMRSPDRGNGIHLTNVTDTTVAENQVQTTRDGLYIINSQRNKLLNNHLSDLRFGIHYMYSHNNIVASNVAEDVDVGYALMSSNQLTIKNNEARRCRDYGLLLNFVNSSTFLNNAITDVTAGDSVVLGDEGKALFVYNATQNHIEGNTFANSNMGVHLTAGSVGNKIFNNQFVNNEIQVKYVATETQEWSENGQGNYWSNYLGWDLNQDGLGDTAFEPNDDVEKLIWKYPEAKVIMDSPAVLLIRWVQRSFPILKSPGVKDSFPQYQYKGPTQ